MPIDMRTDYLGLTLRNPLVASACPLSRHVSGVRAMEDAGIAAVVVFSLFEEEIHHGELSAERYQSHGRHGGHAEAADYFPDHEQYEVGPDSYLRHLENLKKAVDIPVIASLNGVTPGGWIEHARQIAAAGADALELNIYYIGTDPDETGNEIEDRYLDTVTMVKQTIDIPVAVKLSPFFSSLANIAVRLVGAGSDALVLFNRFYQPDFDLEEMQAYPHVLLSSPQDLRLPLRWIAILYGQVEADLAATSGIHTAEDVIKVIMAGANVAMMASALLARGVDHAHEVLWQVEQWLEEHEYESVAKIRATMSQQRCVDPSVFERANYLKALETYVSKGPDQ